MQKWEYLFLEAKPRGYAVNGQVQVGIDKKEFLIHDFANQLGADGWELVAAPFTPLHDSTGTGETTARLIFKRGKA